MAHPTDWDVEQYRIDHEPPEHWRLCRAFIETHKADYPEESLVYLAQCFANMELLGCQYPEEVVQLVRRMSAGVAEDCRLEKQEEIQEETMSVRVSDAADIKVARTRSVREPAGGMAPKSYRLCEEKPAGNSAAFILVEDGDERVDDNPVDRLMCSSEFCKVPVKFNLIGNVYECRVGGDLVGTGKRPDGPNAGKEKRRNAAAKMAAATEALAVLRRRCYTIRLKSKILPNEDVKRDELVADEGEAEAAQKLTDGVGGKLLAMMGWTGGGLGKQKQGITEPVRVEAMFGRHGLGSEKRTVTKEFKKKAQLRLRAYASKFQERDLSFSKEFTDEERKEIHTLAKRFGLKCDSQGKGDDRFLVVSHKLNPQHLLQYLVDAGGETDKFELIPPQTEEAQRAENKATEKRSSSGRREVSMGIAGGGTSAKLYGKYDKQPAGNSDAFILVESGDTHVDDNPMNRLWCSSVFCKVPVDINLNGDVWEVRVGGDLVGTGKRPDGPNAGNVKRRNTAAKIAAAAEALAVLHRRCYTIRLKSKILSVEDVARGELVAGEKEAAQKLGVKLLAMMGLTVGGQGKEGLGTAGNWEPVRLDEVIGEQGLGSEKRSVTPEFKEKTKLLLRAYASKLQGRDLLFSAEFTDEESIEVHTLANRLGLRCKGFGRRDGRVLLVTHRFFPHKLLQYLMATGGETDTYELIPPQTEEVPQTEAPQQAENTATEDGSPGRCEMLAGVADYCLLERQEILEETTSVCPSDVAEAKAVPRLIASDAEGGTSAKSYRLCKEKSAAFILVEYGDTRIDDNPVNRLRCSSGFCKVAVRLDFKGDVCECRVGGDLLGTGKRPDGPNPGKDKRRNAAAKMAAAAEALEVLRRRCYTIRLKSKILSDEDVTGVELVAEQEKGAQKVADGVGGKLLAMMGWTAGGLGKQKKGIAEQVRLDELIGRQVFWSEKRAVSQEFKDKTELRLREYASKFQERDLCFSKEFTGEERMEVHTLAMRLGLRCRSHGKGGDRVAEVSHRFNPHHLLQYLIAMGGDTDKFELIPPQTEEVPQTEEPQRAKNTTTEEGGSPGRCEMSVAVVDDCRLENQEIQKSSVRASDATEAKEARKRIAYDTVGGTSATSYVVCKKPAGNSAAFILVEDDDTRADGHPVSRIKRASHACKVPVSLGFKGNTCECRVGGELLGTGIRPDGPNDKEKRRNAPAKMDGGGDRSSGGVTQTLLHNPNQVQDRVRQGRDAW